MVLSLYNTDEVGKIKEGGRVTMQMGIGSGDDYSLIGKRKNHDPCYCARNSGKLLQYANVV